MLREVEIQRWCRHRQAHVLDYAAQTPDGDRVKTVHTCPRCTELKCGSITAVEMVSGKLFMAEELCQREYQALQYAVMSFRVVKDLPCINHDGVT